LRDDLVTATSDVEAVDEVAAEHRAEIFTDLLHVQTERGDLVAIEYDLSLRLVNLGVDERRKSKHPALRRFSL